MPEALITKTDNLNLNSYFFQGTILKFWTDCNYFWGFLERTSKNQPTLIKILDPPRFEMGHRSFLQKFFDIIHYDRRILTHNMIDSSCVQKCLKFYT